ncbi:MAG: hypothetical protein IJ290_01370 [Bacteroidaceae bacterium]|nr:hypothetical protein [Bacteroidaceae bacterium]
MRTIEKIAERFTSVYNSGNREDIDLEAKTFLREIKRDEYQFKNIEHPYAMACSLYYLLIQDEYELLTNEEYCTIIKLIYYSLLSNYLKNKDVSIHDVEYRNVIGGSELACIVFDGNAKCLIHYILSGMLHYMPPYSEMHLRNQLLLFGGIVIDAHKRHVHYFSDELITRQFKTLTENISHLFPTDEELQKLKNESLPVIQDIFNNLGYSFRLPNEPDFF